MTTEKPLYESKTAWLCVLFAVYALYCYFTGTPVDMAAFSAFLAGIGLTFRHAISG